MVDRQDIDALLVSALYGELTPADEARLAQHLESHPTDRTVLDDLTRARAAVRDSRIFEVQLDPPQAVSALLLQEAARRAPRKVKLDESRPSWFSRFVHSVMAHPAMAAAASLVLVVGVAGTLYLRHGDAQMVEQTVSESEHKADGDGVAVATQQPATVVPNAAPAPEPANAETPPVQIAADDYGGKDLHKGKAGAQIGQGSAYNADLDPSVANRRIAPADPKPLATAERQRQTQTGSTKPTGGLVVRSPDRQPKDLADNEGRVARNDNGIAGDSVAGPGGGGAGAAATTTPTTGFADTTKQQAPGHVAPHADANTKLADKAPAKPTTASPSPAPPPAATVARSAEKAEAKKESSENAWAQDQLGKAIKLAQAAKCGEAAKTTLAIANRAPEFYAQNVVDNRQLKSCRSYIEAEREKDSESRAKSKPAKRSAPAEADMKVSQ